MDIETVLARVVKINCEECFAALARESKSFPERLLITIEGEIVNIPADWLDRKCPHGREGVKFRLEMADPDAPKESQRAKSCEVELEATDNSKMDATKHIGHPVREHGSYGTHSMHDDFKDESGPDGSGTY